MAIPARNEAGSIEACLSGLNRQTRLPDAVVLLINNSDDATEDIAAGMRGRLSFDLRFERRDISPEGAGPARRLAMARAADLAGADGYLLTTDADGEAAEDWIARNLESLEAGQDVVCGRALLNVRDVHLIPNHLHDDDRLECRLIELLDRMAWILDPERTDPYPRHTEASGASLAVTAGVFRMAGGIPAVPCGEDRQFVRTLWSMDRRIRHDPRVIVTVSGRLEGRASGGMADAMRRRLIQQDEFTDEQVEPAADGWRRYGLRRLTREAWSEGKISRNLIDRLGIAEDLLQAAMASPFFGAAWVKLECLSPVLSRRRVRFVDLPQEIAAAEALLGPSDLMAAD